MAEAIAALGLAANIAELVVLGAHLVHRLRAFHSSATEVPKVFSDINVELPLLLDTLEKTQNQAQLERISTQTQKALIPVIGGCRAQAELLDEIITKVFPASEDSAWRRGRKAVSSIGVEKKAQSIMDTLRDYVQLLTYYQTATLANSEPARVQADKKPTFMVPFERDLKYVDRPDIMLQLYKKLEVNRRAALAGLGGVGKTQIAIEYCYRYHDQNPTANVFWIQATTAPRLVQSYKQIARRLDLPGWDDMSLDTFQIVSEWLNHNSEWLLVLDNADDVGIFFAASNAAAQTKQLHEYVPRSPDGTTIITTRDKRVAYRLSDREDPITVPPMTLDNAKALLASKILPDELRLADLETERRELLEVLGNLPLAITQAAAFINENNLSVAEYLEIFRTNQSEVEDLLSEEIGDHRRYADSASSTMNTLKLSFDQVTKQRPLAAEILAFMAFLDRNGIPKSLLKRENVRTVDFISALGALQAFSLITAKRGGASFEMHRLVQLAIQRWSIKSQVNWQEEVLKVMSEKFPPGDYDNWVECELLSPHAQVVLHNAGSSDSSLLRRAKILHNLARFDDQQSRYEISEARYHEAIAIREKILGRNDPDTLASMSYLGEVLFREAKYEKAEPILQHVIDECEVLYGSKDWRTVINIGHLAEVVQGQGKFADAEKLYRRALSGTEDDLETFTTLKVADNLGAVLRDCKRYDEAEMWVRRALVGREKLFGANHFETLRSVNHLVLLLTNMGRLEEAEIMSRRAVAGSEAVTSRDHQLAIGAVWHLSDILRLQGNYEAATEQCTRALDGLTKNLGPHHRTTLRCLQDFALIKEGQCNFDVAETILVQVVQGNEEALGPDHAHTLASIKDLERVAVLRKLQASNIA